MKNLLALILISLFFMMSCADSEKGTEAQNPFFAEYDTPFGVPPFDLIKAEHFMPAFEKGMEESKKEVEAILSSTEEPTFENTFVALDRAGELLSKVSTVFFGLSSANTSPEIQEIQMEISPKLAAHNDEISLDPRLYEKLKALYDKRDKFNLTDEELFLLESQYMALVRNGAGLSDEDKEKLKAYNQEISILRVKLQNNVLAETNSYMLEIKNKEDLAGLPDAVIATAAETAKQKDKEGWIFTTQKPSMIPFLQYSENRDLRKKLYNAYTSRANNDNDYDNKELLAKLFEIRAERAALLGYDTHSHLVLEPRMAKEPANVYSFIDQVWEKALPVAKNEVKMMQEIINREGGDFKLAASDWWYYSEKLRKEKYDLDDSELRPYFKLDNVMQGAFTVASKLYGITFTEIENIPKPHPDAVAFEVNEADGSHTSVLYLDFHPRDSKKQGAWCGGYRGHRVLDGKEITPVSTMVMNFTSPSADIPSLLSIDEVSTLFHEFGHALDGLLSEKTYNSSDIAWDFVELPSQIMEHWVAEPEVLKMYATHYQTGEVIPDELIQKMENSSYFNQGFVTVEYMSACYLDMAYSTVAAGTDIDVAEFETKVLDKIGLIDEIVPRYRSTYFMHIVGGYDSGYYSYDWAGILDNDAFEAFKENGIFDRETAQSFRDNVLAKNGTKDAMEMYVAFRGREPKIDSYLRNKGLL
ncbi:MAG: M3 family metallopeptidase [Marinilabiliaceae bacterium]|nr:M3 family metallopeptidase [Marinilabiliaceae bacterium]